MTSKTAIDLFSGAGGLSEGFRQAGYEILAGSDIDEAAGKTYEITHPEAKFFLGPIQKLTPAVMLKKLGLKKGELDVVLGGPPCQGYSVYNHQRGADDPRAGLFKEYLRVVKGLQPKWLVMENVTGITSIADGAIVREIVSGMEKLGYRVEMKVLKSEEFGVPQERRRVFFVGTRTDCPILFPKPTHGPGLKPYITIWDAISDLPKLKNGESANASSYRHDPKTKYQRELRGKTTVVQNHHAPNLSEVNEKRMSHVPQGGSWRDIPVHLLPEGMKRAKRSDHTKRYGRMKAKGLSCTILTKCDVHWGAYLHPYQNRAITVREAARLQSFPDSFIFQGSKTEQYVQVGNAVPPKLGKEVAKALLLASITNDEIPKGEVSRSLGEYKLAS